MADTQEWPLQELLAQLRRRPGDPGPAHVSIDLRDEHGELLPAGTALLALLEVEHCKRRVIAAGWAWSENTNGGNADCPLAVYDLRDRVYSWHAIEPLGDTVTVEHARAAAEYAEAHAQGVQE